MRDEPVADGGEAEMPSPIGGAQEFSVEHDPSSMVSRLQAAEKQLRLASDAAETDEDRQDCVWLRKRASDFIEDKTSGDCDA